MASGGKMELALEDIIKQNPNKGSRRGGSRGGGARRGAPGGARSGARRAGGGGGSAASFSRIRQAGSFTRPGGIPEGPWNHDRFGDSGDRGFGGRMRGNVGGMNSTAKLLVTNLDFSVSDSDIKELFSEFGLLRRAAVHYDKSARSLGSADVVFERRSDATRALKQYNNVPLDGRPMKIQLVDSGSAVTSFRAGGSVFNRVQMGGSRNSGGGGYSGGRRSAGGMRREPSGGRGGRGSGGRGGGRGGKREPPPSIEDLDKELDAYVNKMDS